MGASGGGGGSRPEGVGEQGGEEKELDEGYVEAALGEEVEADGRDGDGAKGGEVALGAEGPEEGAAAAAVCQCVEKGVAGEHEAGE